MDTKFIKIVAINTQGWFEDELNRFVNKCKPDVLICTEHKQRSLDAISDTIEGYLMAAGYAATKGTRGSVIFVREGLHFVPRRDLDSYAKDRTFECCNVEVVEQGTRVIVTGLYRSPNSRIPEFNKILTNFVKHTSAEFGKIAVIGGDLNIDLASACSTSDVLRDNNLRSHVRAATHIDGGCLDNFITPADAKCQGRCLNSHISDHRPILLQVPITSLPPFVWRW